MKDIYQEITDRILNQLEKGVVPWQQPWKTLHHANFITRKQYQGVNQLMTSVSPYGSPYWVTFKQAIDLKGSIKKGEKSTPIVYWNFSKLLDDKNQPKLDKHGREQIVPFVRYSNVFNLEQTQGITLPAKETIAPSEPLLKAQEIVDKANLCPIKLDGSGASYSPERDFISIPPPLNFKCPEQYFHVLFHEMTHATGHPSRLNRDLSGKFGSPSYAKEELAAEISSCFLSNHAGTMGNVLFENSTGYLDHWAQKLQKDKSLIVAAASAAGKAADFIIGNKIDATQTVTTTEQPTTTQGLSPSMKLIAKRKLNTNESLGESQNSHLSIS